MAVALIVGWLLIAAWMFKEWVNEDFITEAEHRQHIEAMWGGER